MRKNKIEFTLLGLLVVFLSVFLLISLRKDSDKTLTFADPGLEQAVRDSIEKTEGSLYSKDVQTIEVLDASNRNIKNLNGIQALTELQELNLENNFIESVSPLKSLVNLQTLNVRNNEITSLEKVDFQEITFLHLEKLSLRHNIKRDENGNATRLEDISILGRISTLEELELRDNHIEDLNPLSNLLKLKKLDIRENKFKSIEPLQYLARLEKLNLRKNKVQSLEPLRPLTRLTYLNIHSNPNIESLEPLKDLMNLETLIMENVPVDDLQFLSSLTQLQRFNAVDTGIEKLDPSIIEGLVINGALQGEVRPVRMLYTLDAPLFSNDTGFYTEEFPLEIFTEFKNQNIYYTLDGSDPSVDSPLYTEPIKIKANDGNSATVVRAKIISEENTISETVTKTYFISENLEERFDLPVFSLVTDPKNLFDEETGIYIEENVGNSGSDWERPVHVEYLEPDGTVTLTQNAGIRIHGGATRGYAQKSLRLYAKSDYSPEDSFKNVFFPNLFKKNSKERIDSFKHLILRNSGNDTRQTMFNDGLMQELAEPIGTFDTQAFQPSIIFINGEYHGIQNIRERFDEHYLENHYDIDQDDVVILENNAELYRGGNKDVYHYQNMLKYIEENSLQKDENLDYIETMMDFDSFIDYFATEIYYGNVDWPHNNIKFWRKTTNDYVKNAPYGHDGRWRWALLDTDHGFYYSDNVWGYTQHPINHKHNTIEWVMNEFDGRTGERTWPNFLFRKLMENQKFKNQFLVRFNDIANGYLNEYAATQKIDEKVNLLNQEINYHLERWDAIPSKEYWNSYVDKKRLFAKERPHLIREFMMEEFEIEDTISVQLSNESESGSIRLNQMNITEDLPGNDGSPFWSGTYFKGIPITVEAISKDGYIFSHWEGLDSKESYIELDPVHDMILKAIFIKK